MLKPIHIYYLSNFLFRKKFILLSMFVDYINRIIFTCWIPGQCQIGKNVVLGYWGMGIILHKDCIIEDNVHIDQLVTVGGNAVEEGVPHIKAGCYIGAGAKILGPVVVNEGSVIGANAVVLNDVLPATVVAGVPAKLIKSNITINEYLHHKKIK